MSLSSIPKFVTLVVLLAGALSCFAINEEDSEKIEGTANPEPSPTVDEEKAILSTIQYPEEMIAKLFAREPNVQDPTAITFDEQNRLYIAETHRFARGVEDNRRNPWTADDYALTSTAGRLEMYKKYSDNKPLSYFTEYSEKIRVIEDRDGDGKADFGQIYADGFNDPLDGTAAGVMALDGKIYFACIPHVWLLEDSDGDLVADKRESLQEGYGISVSLSGHDLNGFALGPDNRIYFTIGDRGYNLKTKEGRHLYSQYEGAAFRMERDGSNLEVVHTGLRNPKEVAFDRFGNLFSVDNNADMGDEARVVEIIEGAHSGWQRGHQAFQKFTNLIYGTRRHQTIWMEERWWDMDSDLRPAAILRPSGWLSKGPSGLAYDPGTGLAGKWDNHFFICDFTGANSAVIGFEMEPEGAGYIIKRSENFVSGLLCTDIEFGYDSKAYISDYVGSWPTHGFGNILSFENPDELEKPKTKEVRKIFSKGFSALPPEELAGLLRHPDMRVRLRSQLSLAADASNREIFIAATDASEPITTRLHGIWGLGNLARLKGDAESAKKLTSLCSDSVAMVRSQAVKTLGESDRKAHLEAALNLLSDPDPRTRMQAAIATGKLGSAEDIPSLMAVIEANNDGDEYLRHGAIQGMITINDADAIYAFAQDDAPAVRRSVVLALRRIKDARIAYFLKDEDLSIAVESVQAINDEYIEGARAELAMATHLLGKSTWMVDRRILNAMIRTGGEENIQRLIEIAENTDLSENVRTEALWLLGRFDKHPPTDPTTGMFRPIVEERKISQTSRDSIGSALLPLLASTSGTVLEEAIKLAGKLELEIPQETLISQLSGTGNPQGVRLAALKKLESDQPEGFNEILAKLTSDEDAKIRATALQALGRAFPEEAFQVTGRILSSGIPSDKQLAIGLLATLDHPDAETVLLGKMKNLNDQLLAIRLDIMEAASKRGTPALKEAIASHEASIPKDDPLAAFEITLEGGNPDNGKVIFFRNGMANCRQCHKVGQRGGDAGPNLLGIASRHDANYILESIIVPSAKLTTGYSTVAVTLKDGTVVAGTLASETESAISIQDLATKEQTTIKREDIASMPAPMSTMPPMGLILKKTQIRDLVAYLSSLKE